MIQIYQIKDKDVYIESIIALDYTLDPNVFNLILNLILDSKDFTIAISMFELIFD